MERVDTMDDWMNVPSATDMEEHIREFFVVTAFPQGVRVLDGCHFPASLTKTYASDYYNYNGWYSIILLVPVDHSYRFRHTNVGSPGRCHDSDITRFFDMGYLNNVHHDQTIATIGPDTQASDMVRLERFSWDFAKGAEESCQKIDHYARLYANAFEPDEILPQGCITPASRVCTLSVVDFRASWKQVFDERFATRGQFHEPGGNLATVIMVHQTGRFRIATCSDLNATAVEIPYEQHGRCSDSSAARSGSCLSTPKSGFITQSA
ncbi:hypothetical protein MRX96_007647 [Rhipicephalus microplus]